METLKRRFLPVILAVMIVLGACLSLAAPAPSGAHGSAGSSSVAYIRLTILSPQGTLWYDPTGRTQAVVEWEDGNGGWHTVDTWVTSPTTQVTWQVWPKDYGTGPFRWVVYDQGRPLGTSQSFYLPTADGQVTDVVVVLSELPWGATPMPIVPTPTPSGVRYCPTPAYGDFQQLWTQYAYYLGCPTGPGAKIPKIAEQALEGGHMFWRNDLMQVYIIYDRNKSGAQAPVGNWSLETRQWDNSYPDGVGLSAPPGRQEPKRGFGWLWRNYYGGPPGALGWALDKEYGFDDVAAVQRYEHGLIFRGSDPKTYVLLDNGQFFSSLPGGPAPLPPGGPALLPPGGPAPLPPSSRATYTRPSDGMTMVYAPPGQFQMGSTDAELDYAMQLSERYQQFFPGMGRQAFTQEQPAHTVVLDGLWIDQTEVTNAQYRRCVDAHACAPAKYWNEPDVSGDRQPVVGVSWHDAAGYCQWAGVRLPTEAEWEYAARGPERRVFPWGNSFDGTRVNYCDARCEKEWADTQVVDGYARTSPVGSFPGGASWTGALDLAGNVWEWVSDGFGSYHSETQWNPTGPTNRDKNVLRGGSWDNPPFDVRSAARGRAGPDEKARNYGFRCAATSGQPSGSR